MRTERLNYHLPAELIAQQPAEVRSASKLLVLKRGSNRLIDSIFSRIGEFLRPGDCLVLNDAKVLPARFFARRTSGAGLEGLFLAETGPGLWEVMLKGAGKIKTGESIYLKDKEKRNFCTAKVLDKTERGTCRVKIETGADAESILKEIGFPPLPPYIKRSDDPVAAARDKLRYQTVYARHGGAVAAPTAGLHFTRELIRQLKASGIALAYITLDVGPGTFKPVTTENLQDYKMHREKFSINEQNALTINRAREQGGRIITVGTTSARALETAANGSQIKAVSGTTRLFIKPGYQFRMVDALVTNFHLPRSTLLALVAAFAGLERVLAAYHHAIRQQYRFYSYGDAMLII